MEFSYSRVSSYIQCPQKYNWHYVKEIVTKEPYQLDTLRGLALHNFAEETGLELTPEFNKFIESFEIKYILQENQVYTN